jgi:hypothetical protein
VPVSAHYILAVAASMIRTIGRPAGTVQLSSNNSTTGQERRYNFFGGDAAAVCGAAQGEGRVALLRST